MSLAKDIKQKALELGFDLVGITDASPIDAKQVELLAGWLKSGFAGQMDYMHRNFEKRINPTKLLKNAQSVICLALNYNPPKPSQSLRALRSISPSSFRAKGAFSPERSRRGSGVEESVKKSLLWSLRARRSRARQSHLLNATAPAGRVANYAQYEDYHPFVKKQLRKLIDFIASVVGPALKFKICVDSVPLAERALAARAGLGFIGKNHMLINPTLGAQIFLGEIITNLKIQPDEPIKTNCSNCDECISACPTRALRADGQFDAGKCISYLTTVRQAHRPEQGRRIEHKGRISADLAEKIGDRLFGCDECVLACPYQKNVPACKNKQFKFYSDRANLNLHEILSRGRPACLPYNFEAKFADSVIKRIGLDALKRNAQICLANITR